jgi:hypothetical protein
MLSGQNEASFARTGFMQQKDDSFIDQRITLCLVDSGSGCIAASGSWLAI